MSEAPSVEATYEAILKDLTGDICAYIKRARKHREKQKRIMMSEEKTDEMV